MATDFLSMTDNKFLADNLLSTEDWDIDGLDGRELDNLFDVEAANFDPDELMKSIGADIDLSSIYGNVNPETVLNSNDLPMEVGGLDDRHSDSNSDSGISTLSIKQEPQSPASSNCSENSNDSVFSQKVYRSDQWKLDTPPLTPPRDPNDAYTFSINTSRAASAVTTAQPLPTSGAIYNLTSDLCTIKQEPLPANVVNVLNSKVKIQPKPKAGGSLVNASSVIQPTKPVTSSKPLVLSAEEFAKLTAQGVLKFQQPSASPSLANNSTTVASHSIPETKDVKLIKRQQRMIKNRESACLSRKRKKEYMSSIEVQLHEFTVENERLKHENLFLKNKITSLENENDLLKKGVNISSISKKAATTCVLSVLLLLCLNLTSFSILPNRANRQDDLRSIGIPQSMVRHGRTLLSYDDTQRDDKYNDAQFTQKYDHKRLNKAIQSLKKNFKSLNEFASSDGGELSNSRALLLLQHLQAFSSCPSYFNRTESQRLANELTGWVLAHKEVNRKEKEIKEKQKKKKVHKPLTKLQAAMKGQLDIQRRGNSPYQVQVFQKTDRSYLDFLNSINRRDDTFYVVSFKRDHLLLPATAHNKTMRPRMSLVMPAVTLNDSMQPPDNHVAMMQIDCEVMDTRLLHVKKSSIPSYATTNNRTTGSPSEVGQTYTQQDHVTQRGQGRGQKLSGNGKRKLSRKTGK